MTILAGIETSAANFAATGSIYNSTGGEWFAPYTVLENGDIDTLEANIFDMWTSSAFKLVLRNSTGGLLGATGSLAGTGVKQGAITPVAVTAGQTVYLGIIPNTGYIKPRQNATTYAIRKDAASTFVSPAADVDEGSATQAVPLIAINAQGTAGAPTPTIFNITNPADTTVIADLDNPDEINSVELVVDGNAITIDAWSVAPLAPDDSRVTITLNRDDGPFYGPVDIQISMVGDVTAPAETVLNVEAGKQAQTFASPDTSAASLAGLLAVGSDPVIDGDQYLVQHSVPDLTITLNANGILSFSKQGPFEFQAQLWQASTNTRSDLRTFSVDAEGNITPAYTSYSGEGFVGEQFTSTGFIGRGF